MFIAHRGKVTDGVKENSLQAFRNAYIDNKYIGIECDIRVSKDGYFVIVHDAVADGKIVKLTKYRDLGLPLLKELLRIKTDKIIMIELKDENIELDKLVRMLNKSKRNIYVMSFNRKLMIRLSEYSRKFRVGVLNYVLNSEEEYDHYDFVCLLNSVITSNLLNYFKKRKIQVFSYGLYKNIVFNEELIYIVDDKLINK